MRASLFIAALVSLCLGAAGLASATPSNAGVARLTVAGAEPFDMLVWYPTPVEAAPWQAGPFIVRAGRDAPIAPGRFPVVLLSHGGGRTGGSPMLLGQLSARLAREGFIVIAPFHGRTRFVQRTHQMVRSFEAAQSDSRLGPHIAADRVATLGFSLGGAVALVLAGAIPDFALLDTYCAAHPEDARSCGGGPSADGGAGASPAMPRTPRPVPPVLPLRALVLLDPFAVLFGKDGLAGVRTPVLLVRPRDSSLGEDNVRSLADGLPRPPQLERVPGGHFIFVDICPAALSAEAPELCRDAAGVDRTSVHSDVEAAIVRFLRANL
ncbi:dienelactone hydrolase [Allostella sp. ATCC 35155]|nr:dienelactone hydrolase [Stella sp. ATCC 35155]